MQKDVKKNWIANFWRRVGALFVDSLILSLVGFLLGLVFESTFVQMGGWGRIIGFSISLAYFGLMNSRLCNGQTIGKRLLSIRVVDLDNHTIPLSKSLLRYIVLAVPFSLNGLQLSSDVLLSYLMYPISMVLFGGILSVVYLYICNRVTRQSLHDLAVGTFVVNANIEKQEVGEFWKPHLIIVPIFFVVAAIVPVFTGKLAQGELFKDMLAAQSALSTEKEVSYATVASVAPTFMPENEGAKSTAYVTVQVFLTSNKIHDVELARKFAAIVIRNYPESVNKDSLTIALTYGYDIGIWSQRTSYRHDFTPGEFTQ